MSKSLHRLLAMLIIATVSIVATAEIVLQTVVVHKNEGVYKNTGGAILLLKSAQISTNLMDVSLSHKVSDVAPSTVVGGSVSNTFIEVSNAVYLLPQQSIVVTSGVPGVVTTTNDNHYVFLIFDRLAP